jgi:hypothetical protein
MTQLYFHCSNSNGRAVATLCGAVAGDLAEARDHAAIVVRSIVMTASPEDWRDWILHVSDDLGEDVFVVPFAFVLGKPNRRQFANEFMREPSIIDLELHRSRGSRRRHRVLS